MAIKCAWCKMMHTSGRCGVCYRKSSKCPCYDCLRNEVGALRILIKGADEWIRFEKFEKQMFWFVRTRKTDIAIGFIKWYPSWRHYCFFPLPDTVYSDRCLIAIWMFMQKLEKERKK
jgi:hypothetical protein